MKLCDGKNKLQHWFIGLVFFVNRKSISEKIKDSNEVYLRGLLLMVPAILSYIVAIITSSGLTRYVANLIPLFMLFIGLLIDAINRAGMFQKIEILPLIIKRTNSYIQMDGLMYIW